MGTAYIVFRQTVVMFLYMFAGYLMFRTEKLSKEGGKDIANLLVWLVIPAVIINSFCVERSQEKISELLYSTGLGVLGLTIAIVIARIIYRNHPVDNFGAAMCNAGFIGIPLVQAAFGDKAVFWIVPIVAMLNMLQWSYGVGLLTGEKSAMGWRHLLFNPILVSAVAGITIFLTGAGSMLPEIISSTLEGLSSLNAPVAMIVMGSYLAQSDMKRMFTSARLYLLCAVRLLLIPAVTLAAFRFIPVPQDILMTIFIALSTPIGANVAVYARIYDCDYPYACQTVTITTLVSIVTLPVMLMLADIILL